VNDLLTAKEVAKILGIGQSTAARLMARNEIRSFKLGPRLLPRRAAKC
jgi:excisionase family DNA binding protein